MVARRNGPVDVDRRRIVCLRKPFPRRNQSSQLTGTTVLGGPASCLILLLLSVEALRPAAYGPDRKGVLCGVLKAATAQIGVVRKAVRRLQSEEDGLSEVQLESLPVILMTAAHFYTLKADERLSQLYVHALSLGAHADWLRTASHDVSLPFEAAGEAAVHLLRLAGLVRTALRQMGAAVPASPPHPSLPTVRSAFSTLRYSAEISRCLAVFCGWSRRLLHHVRRTAACRERKR
ncbi:uncharacterized protein LOC144066960 [Stigmatopora argus]